VDRPTASEHAPFYERYVALVPGTDVLGMLERQRGELRRLAAGLDPEREELRYAPGKWSVREVLGHVRDGEREFGHRAFRFSRADPTPLPGFEENHYVAAASFDRRPASAIVAELTLLREANLAMLRQLPDEAWERTGTASGMSVSVRALAFILAGHLQHHLNVLRERYGVAAGPSGSDAASGVASAAASAAPPLEAR
jgi:hypothetical protein